MNDITWKCDVCARERPDAMIWVFKRDISAALGLPAGGSHGRTEKNFRYCIDNEECCSKVAQASRGLTKATVHDLKCWPEPFEAMLDGIKTFEFRKNDRGFKIGDYLRLCEWRPYSEDESTKGEFTGRVLFRLVTYVLRGPSFGLAEGYAVLSVRETNDTQMHDRNVQGTSSRRYSDEVVER